MNQQFSLFSTEPAGPAGLRYYPAIITRSTEQDLIERIRGLPLVPFQFGAYEGKRRVASFGFKYDYTLKRLQEAEELPEWLAPTIAKIEVYGGPAAKIRQVLCTEYDVGVGIGWHRDKPHFGEVFGLSLGSACKFRFRRKIAEKWERFTPGCRVALALHHDGGIPARMGAQHPSGRRAAVFDHLPLDGEVTMHLIEIFLPVNGTGLRIRQVCWS